MEFRSHKNASVAVELAASQEIKIEANGEELLSVEVPEGKIWNTKIVVFIEESDA